MPRISTTAKKIDWPESFLKGGCCALFDLSADGGMRFIFPFYERKPSAGREIAACAAIALLEDRKLRQTAIWPPTAIAADGNLSDSAEWIDPFHPSRQAMPPG